MQAGDASAMLTCCYMNTRAEGAFSILHVHAGWRGLCDGCVCAGLRGLSCPQIPMCGPVHNLMLIDMYPFSPFSSEYNCGDMIR